MEQTVLYKEASLETATDFSCFVTEPCIPPDVAIVNYSGETSLGFHKVVLRKISPVFIDLLDGDSTLTEIKMGRGITAESLRVIQQFVYTKADQRKELFLQKRKGWDWAAMTIRSAEGAIGAPDYLVCSSDILSLQKLIKMYSLKLPDLVFYIEWMYKTFWVYSSTTFITVVADALEKGFFSFVNIACNTQAQHMPIYKDTMKEYPRWFQERILSIDSKRSALLYGVVLNEAISNGDEELISLVKNAINKRHSRFKARVLDVQLHPRKRRRLNKQSEEMGGNEEECNKLIPTLNIQKPPKFQKEGKTHTSLQMSRNTSLSLALEPLKAKWGVNNIILNYDGEIIDPKQTPRQAKLKDGDLLSADFPEDKDMWLWRDYY